MKQLKNTAHLIFIAFTLIAVTLTALSCSNLYEELQLQTEFEKTKKSAGSMSFAVESVEKTTDDEPFTNTLTIIGDGTVSYTSSDESVATVDARSGSVTIVGAGSATITATVTDGVTHSYESKTASFTLTVTLAQQKSAGSMSFAAESVEKTTADEPFTNTLTIIGDGAVSYASSDVSVATVDAQSGSVTIVGAGSATITATVTDGVTHSYETKTASFTLTVTLAQQEPVGSVTVTLESDEYKLTPTATATGYTLTVNPAVEVSECTFLIDGNDVSDYSWASLSADGKTLTIDTSTWGTGTNYEISVFSMADGFVYSAAASVKK